MLLIGIAGTEVLPHEHAWLTAPGVAGVILFSRHRPVDSGDTLGPVTRAILGEREDPGDHAAVWVEVTRLAGERERLADLGLRGTCREELEGQC